jgi:transposase-like protein
MNLMEWQKYYGTEEACAQALAQQRWAEGFRCPHCGHDHGYAITTRHCWECSQCHAQTSLTAGTLFHSTNLPLNKWLGYLPGCFRQRWYFCVAFVQTD